MSPKTQPIEVRLADLPEVQRLVAQHARYRQALELIAVGKRSDGTYNRSREACEQLALEALREENE